jgi:hypothetical protein
MDAEHRRYQGRIEHQTASDPEIDFISVLHNTVQNMISFCKLNSWMILFLGGFQMTQEKCLEFIVEWIMSVVVDAEKQKIAHR